MSRASAIHATVQLVPEVCCKCGVVFGVEQSYQAARRRDRGTFHCPNGHGQGYYGPTEAELLRNQLAREKHLREQAEARADYRRLEAERIARRLNATRGVVTRQKRRLTAGQCPCCSVRFKDLRAHMAAEHPHWDPVREADAMAAKGGAGA